MKSFMGLLSQAALVLLIFFGCSAQPKEPKILYYANPMDPTVHSDGPMKDSMGMDYIPVYQDPPEKSSPSPKGKILYYANPMDPTVHSEVPMKDSMGMDYVPVYEETPEEAPQNAKGKILYYANPMDPTVHSEVPVKDSMGMEYIPVYEEPAGSTQGPRGLKITAYQEDLIGVAVSPVTLQTLQTQVQTVGKVSYNEKKTTVVSSRVSGRIESLYVNYTGSTVTRGQALLSLYSPTLVTAQQELIQANRSMKTSEPGGVEESIFRSAKGKLDLWGFSGYQLDKILETGNPENSLILASPLTGTVVKLGVSAGMYVNEGTILYELSDLSRVWIEAEIFENDLAAVRPDSLIRVVPQAYPEETFEDKISFINPSLDPNTRTVKIRTEIPNPKGLLLPGMFVSVLVLTPSKTPVLTIPESSVIDTGLRKIVYVKTKPGHYVSRDLILGPRSGNLFPVVRGLEAGELVVTSANFLIDSESRLKGLVN